MSEKIEALTLSVGQIFNDSYTVPIYQREYVWNNSQVLQLLDDISNSFEMDDPQEYFVGSTIVCKNSKGLYDIIDGQQRLTTLYIALCCLRDIIKNSKNPNTDFINKMISDNGNDEKGDNIYRYRISLQYVDSRDILDRLANGEGEKIGLYPLSKSMENIFKAYMVIKEFVKNNFIEDIAKIRSFTAYLKDRVNLIRIETKDVNHALRIFETINSRGISLNPMDLLKNLIFMKAKTVDFEKISINWKEAMDNIELSKEPPVRFLVYFVTAFYSDKVINENQIYEWFLKNSEKYAYPLIFSKEILEASKSFKNYVFGNNPDGTENKYLQNLKLQSSKSTRHIILLLAVSKKGNEFSNEVARFLENLLFVYMITSTNTRKLDTKFSEWARSVGKINKLEELKKYLNTQQSENKDLFYERFSESMLSSNFGTIHKTRLRYVLGKMSQYINEIAYGSAGSDSKISTFVNSDVEVEHVLPLKPSSIAIKEFGDSRRIELYQNKLGNLTLIEKSINGHLGNKPFSKKGPVYTESKFLLTRILSGSHDLGNTLVTKALADFSIFKTWDSNSIDERSKQLFELSKIIWEMD